MTREAPALGAGRWGGLRLRLLHRLLTPGSWLSPTAAARLRGWARVLDWREAIALGQRRAVVRSAAAMPVRAWREAGRAVEQFGGEVEAVCGVPPRAQRRQLWWLAVRHGLNATSYLDFQLYRPERRRRAAAYLQEREYFRVGLWLNRHVPRTDGYPIADKRRFVEWCRANSLAAVPTLLEYEQGALVTSALADPASSLPRRDLFSKPSDGTGGQGTERWRHVTLPDGGAGWMGSDGRVRSAADLLQELARASEAIASKHGRAARRILLQPCLHNHRELLPLTPGGLCTVRVVTYRAPGAGARVLLGAYKMPVGDSPADNFHFGGIVAPVDAATGRLGAAIRRQGRVLVSVERHPDTGAPIAGYRLPCWAETMALATAALDAAHRRPSIGWDVAITDDGPVLVEGNTLSNPDIAQAPTGIPLSDTPFPAAIEAHLRAHLMA
ncbi:MAG TPA: sugar-transfer associated ATP-grasp domain-containing protein [Gemmatimonadaceae bacterium]|nr:sugar-transfer associated ATP-grasp domain-containing protein [Gemmatimonadaceae bacterium]